MEKKVEQQLRAPRLRLNYIPDPHVFLLVLHTPKNSNVLGVDQRRYRLQVSFVGVQPVNECRRHRSLLAWILKMSIRTRKESNVHREKNDLSQQDCKEGLRGEA
jgi:hypothetical protein